MSALQHEAGLSREQESLSPTVNALRRPSFLAVMLSSISCTDRGWAMLERVPAVWDNGCVCAKEASHSTSTALPKDVIGTTCSKPSYHSKRALNRRATIRILRCTANDAAHLLPSMCVFYRKRVMITRTQGPSTRASTINAFCETLDK